MNKYKGNNSRGYKNPIPSVDDEYESTKYCICFTFDERATKSEAVRGINELLEEAGGKIPANWIRMGEPRSIRYALPQVRGDDLKEIGIKQGPVYSEETRDEKEELELE